MDKVFEFNNKKKTVKEDGDYIYVGKRRYTKEGYAKLCANLAKARETRKNKTSTKTESNELSLLKQQIEELKNKDKPKPKTELELLKEELAQIKQQQKKKQEEEEINKIKAELELLKTSKKEEIKEEVQEIQNQDPIFEEFGVKEEDLPEEVDYYTASEYFKRFNNQYIGIKMNI